MRTDGAEVLGLDPRARLEAVLGACRERLPRIDLVILGGDQSDDGELASLQEVRDRVAVLGAPLLAVPGNHDDARLTREVFGDRPTVEVAGWCVLALDTTVAGEVHGSADVPGAQVLLDAASRPTLVALHHPPVSPSPHEWFVLEHSPELLASLARRPAVRAVLSGHVHTPFSWRAGPLELLGAPSVLASFGFARPEPELGAGGPTGARALFLERDGGLRSELIEA